MLSPSERRARTDQTPHSTPGGQTTCPPMRPGSGRQKENTTAALAGHQLVAMAQPLLGGGRERNTTPLAGSLAHLCDGLAGPSRSQPIVEAKAGSVELRTYTLALALGDA